LASSSGRGAAGPSVRRRLASVGRRPGPPGDRKGAGAPPGVPCPRRTSRPSGGDVLRERDAPAPGDLVGIASRRGTSSAPPPSVGGAVRTPGGRTGPLPLGGRDRRQRMSLQAGNNRGFPGASPRCSPKRPPRLPAGSPGRHVRGDAACLRGPFEGVPFRGVARGRPLRGGDGLPRARGDGMTDSQAHGGLGGGLRPRGPRGPR